MNKTIKCEEDLVSRARPDAAKESLRGKLCQLSKKEYQTNKTTVLGEVAVSPLGCVVKAMCWKSDRAGNK